MKISSDSEIRAALHRKKLKALHRRQDTLIVDELGLVHAKARIDVAVINGCIHGFEIKSAADSLARLPAQLQLYSECLERLTIVCAEKHLTAVRKIAPRWCGILQAIVGPRGGIEFVKRREPKQNPNIRPYKLAHLLWRPEAIAILTSLNVSSRVLRSPRKQLYKSLASLVTVAQMTALIKDAMANRSAWRGLPTRT